MISPSYPANACRNTAANSAEELQEGKARILKRGNDVFYNEAQVSEWYPHYSRFGH